MTGHDRRTITRALATLERAGWIKRGKGGGRGTTTVYTLTQRGLETGASPPQFPNENRGEPAPRRRQ